MIKAVYHAVNFAILWSVVHAIDYIFANYLQFANSYASVTEGYDLQRQTTSTSVVRMFIVAQLLFFLLF